MGLNILGPLELHGCGGVLHVGGPREQIVLATLALRANRVVSSEQLVDAVWEDSPPSTARGQIQGCVSHLRKPFAAAGLPDAIRRQASGYVLNISEDDLDSSRFARMVAAAQSQAAMRQPAEAAQTLHDALALWRGAALQGIQSETVRRGAAVLDDNRLGVIEERLRLDLELGRHDEIIGELRGLVADHPLRERLHGLLALSMYRSGRQADSLEALRVARSTLADEVGIDPGQELQDLERAILNHEPRLDLAAPGGEVDASGTEPTEPLPTSPQQLPRGAADFIGREWQIERITKILRNAPAAAASHYAVPIVGICGPGGVGKSTLALRVAHESAAEFPDGQLYVDLQGPAVEDRTTLLLARFLRALGVSGSAIPEDRDERAEMYRSLLASKRILLVFDGVVSEGQVLPLLPGTPTCAVVVTTRTRLDFLAGAHWFGLDVFDTATSLEMLAGIIGRDRLEAERESAETLIAYAGGLPLALRIAAARLASRPHWRIVELTRRMNNEVRRLDEFSYRGLELRSSIGSSYRSLSDVAKRLFRLFALTQAPDFPGWTAAALLDTTLAEAERAVELLVDVQLLDTIETPSGEARYRFHDLIRVFAQERLIATETDEERRAALSRLFGAWLALAERAHRREYGGDYTTLHGNAPRFVVADADDELAETAPLDWLEKERVTLVAAVRQAANADMDEVCWDLALTLVSLFEVRGYYDDWRDTAEIALAAAERAGNQLGQAGSLYSLGTLSHTQKQLDESASYFAAAQAIFEAEREVHGQALVLRNAALVDRMRGDIGGMLAKCDQSLGKMRAVGDLVGEANVLRSMAKYYIEDNDAERANRLLSEALELCRRAGYLRGTAQVESRIAEMYLATGETVLARQTLNRVLSTVRELGDTVGEAHALYWLGLVRLREGRGDTAESTLANAVTIAVGAGEQHVEGQAEYALGDLAISRGENEAARRHLARAHEVFGRLGSALWLAKTLILMSGVDDEADMLTPLTRDLDEAMSLLEPIDSREAEQLRQHLQGMRAGTRAH